MTRYFILLALTITLFSGCKKDNPTTGTLKVNFMVEGSDGISQMPFLSEDINGVPMRIELLKVYFAKLALVDAAGGVQSLKDIELLDFGSAELSRSYTVNSGSYASFDFILGIDSVKNASNPVDFEENHPLSISQNMYWTWASKYIFFKIEGRADTTFENLFDQLFIYHVGTDELSRDVRLETETITIEGGKTTEINLILDMNAVLADSEKGVDVVNESLTHTMDNVPLAARIADLMSEAFRLE